jgi:hypothetical protein
MKRILLSGIVIVSALAFNAAQSRLPGPDPDDGAIALPPGFRALVVADNLVVGRKAGNTAERLRGIAVAPNGDIYAKTRLGPIFALRDTTGDGRIDETKEFGPGDGGTHIAFHDGCSITRAARRCIDTSTRRASSCRRARCRPSSRIFPPSAIMTPRRSRSTIRAGCSSRSDRHTTSTANPIASSARKAWTQPSSRRPTAASGASMRTS